MNYSLIRDHKYRSLAASKLFGHLSYGNADAIMNAIGYAEFYSRSHHAVVRVYDEAGNVIRRTNTGAISKSGEVQFELTFCEIGKRSAYL